MPFVTSRDDTYLIKDDIFWLDKWAIWIGLVSLFFLTQIAYNIDEFPVSTDFVAYYLFLLFILLAGSFKFSLFRLVTFLALVLLALLGLFRGELVSASSMALLDVLYFPLAFGFKEDSGSDGLHEYIVETFITCVCILSLIGCAQLILVNATGWDIFRNIAFVLPDTILAAGTYAIEREGAAGVIKANGFFLREPSSLSALTAIAFVLEYLLKARKRTIMILLAGQIASMSGTGILAIAFAFIFPASARSIPRAAAFFIVAAFLLSFGAGIPGANIWFDRLSEFDTEGTSGYARFVAPLEIVERGFSNGLPSMWLGNGPGSYLRAVSVFDLHYEVNDPTWAKLLFEYGIVGFLLGTTLLASRVYSSLLPVEACNCLFYLWVAAGSVIKSEFVFLVWLLTAMPSSREPYIRSVENPRLGDTPID
jgi:hypothetical protein